MARTKAEGPSREGIRRPHDRKPASTHRHRARPRPGRRRRLRHRQLPEPVAPAGDHTIRGFIGSEKAPFFEDPRVVAALKRGGFDVSLSTAGSRQIAAERPVAGRLRVPGGRPAAEKIRRDHAGTQSFVPFYTPMAIATWKPIVDLLTSAGVVHQRRRLHGLRHGRLHGARRQGHALEGPARATRAYPVNKSILDHLDRRPQVELGGDVPGDRDYVANGDNIVENDPQADAISARGAAVPAPGLRREQHPRSPFDDYLVQGMGKSPMVMIYEAQYLARAARQRRQHHAGHGADVPGADDLLEAHVRRAHAATGSELGNS